MHIAFCSDAEAFNKDRLRDKEWSYLFPGSGWVTCLYGFSAESGVDMVSGDIALSHVTSGKWNAKDVCVIQDMVSAVASKLFDLGARPFLITCFEAPLYAPLFYERINRLANDFKFGLGFGFSDDIDGLMATTKNLQFRFPSYYKDDLKEVQEWEGKKNLAIVAANKYRTNKKFITKREKLISTFRQIKSIYIEFISPIYKKSLELSLHDKRLEMIEYFLSNGGLDLYGGGWDNLDELPRNWTNRLNAIIASQYQGRCQNKLETLSNYRFSICFENMVWPGYITEKIIDCFAAGTIPLYLGAPDIETVIPSNSFIDMRHFECLHDVDSYIRSIQADDANRIIRAGRDYLLTEAGVLHSYEGFAKNIIKLAETC